MVTACQPFAVGESGAPAADGLTDAPPANGKSPPTAPTATSTSPTMPAPKSIDFCAGATFCDDFEKSDHGNGLWQGFGAINDDTFGRSAPSAGAGAFSLEVKVGPGSQSKHSAVQSDIGSFGHVEMTFAIRIPPTFGTDGFTNLAHLDFGNESEFVATIMGEQNSVGLAIKDDNRDYQYVNAIEVTPDAWHKVKLVIDLPGTPPTAHMEIDGTDVVTLDTLAVSFDGPPPLELTLGPDYKTTTEPYELRIDDLRIDARN
jgi:hypothetical protein